jgi:hypothetical protein
LALAKKKWQKDFAGCFPGVLYDQAFSGSFGMEVTWGTMIEQGFGRRTEYDVAGGKKTEEYCGTRLRSTESTKFCWLASCWLVDYKD